MMPSKKACLVFGEDSHVIYVVRMVWGVVVSLQPGAFGAVE